MGFDLALTSIAHTPNRIGRLPISVPVEMSDREALGDGEEALVAADGDLACHSVVNIDARRDLAVRESQPGIISGRTLGVKGDGAITGGQVRHFQGLQKRDGIDRKTNWCWSDQKSKRR